MDTYVTKIQPQDGSSEGSLNTEIQTHAGLTVMAQLRKLWSIIQFVIKNDIADIYLQTQKSSRYTIKWKKL